MTTAEIIKGLKAVRTIHNGNYAPYIDGAIKELEVLDRISAEINEQSRMHMDGDLYIKTSACMQIIDKYKAESEKEE